MTPLESGISEVAGGGPVRPLAPATVRCVLAYINNVQCGQFLQCNPCTHSYLPPG